MKNPEQPTAYRIIRGWVWEVIQESLGVHTRKRNTRPNTHNLPPWGVGGYKYEPKLTNGQRSRSHWGLRKQNTPYFVPVVLALAPPADRRYLTRSARCAPIAVHNREGERSAGGISDVRSRVSMSTVTTVSLVATYCGKWHRATHNRNVLIGGADRTRPKDRAYVCTWRVVRPRENLCTCEQQAKRVCMSM